MRKQILLGLIAAMWGFADSAATGQETVKIGLIVPLTGGQASTGKQLDNAVKLYSGRTATALRARRFR